MPWHSSHFCSEAARTKPSKLPRGCSPCPPQLAAENSGVFTLRPVRHARLPVLVGVELARDAVLVEVAAVLRRVTSSDKRLGAGHPVAVHAALEPRVPRPFCTRIDLRFRPVLDEAAIEDAAVVRHVAVEVGGAFPEADRGKMLGLQRGGLPLVLGVIGDAVEADLAVRPGLHARPVDALREILRLAQRPDVDHARASGRRRGCRRGCRHSRPAPISPDRPPPSTGTCWSSRSARPGGLAHMRPHWSCRGPRSAATCRRGRTS